MKPISPVVPGRTNREVVFAKDQPEYIPLPAFRGDDGVVITRWKLTAYERVRLLIGGSLWLSMLTFNRPLQPVKLDAQCPVPTGSGIVSNSIMRCLGAILPARIHSWVFLKSGWMFAAVWVKDRKRHIFIWVNAERYYSGELQSIDSFGKVSA